MSVRRSEPTRTISGEPGGRGRRALSTALMHAQRRGWRPPAPGRTMARHLLRRAAGDAPPIADWSRSLVGDAELGPPPAPADAGISVVSSPDGGRAPAG